MQTAFPQPTTPATFHPSVYIAIVVIVALVPAVILLWPTRKPRLGDGAAWVVLGFFVTVSYCLAMSDLEARTKNLQICLNIWGVIAALYLVNLVRLVKSRGYWSGIESFVITGVAMVGLSELFGPTLETPREDARQTQCRNNLKQIGVALAQYQDRHQKLPHPVSGEPPHSWRVDLLPYLDQRVLFDQYRFDSAWNSAVNLDVARKQIWPYTCSSNPQQQDEQGRYYASYLLLTGPNTLWPAEGPQAWNAAAAGKSQTAMVVEACGKQVVWTEPRELDVTSTPAAINVPGKGPADSPSLFSSFHRNGVHVLMTDGSVRRIPLHTDQQVLKTMIGRNGEESQK